MSILELMLLVFLINLPFVFLLRIFSGFGWKAIPLLMISFAAGQFVDGKLRIFNA